MITSYLFQQHIYLSLTIFCMLFFSEHVNKIKSMGRHLFVKFHHNLVENRMRLAAATNNTIMMRSFLNSGVSPNCCDIQGRTPLHLASCR